MSAKIIKKVKSEGRRMNFFKKNGYFLGYFGNNAYICSRLITL